MANEKITSASLGEELKTTTGEDGFKKLAVKAISALTGAEKQIETADKLIDDQNKAVEEARTSNPNYRPTATFQKKTYQVNHKIRSADGNILSLAEIAADVKLIAELVKSKSTAITELSND